MLLPVIRKPMQYTETVEPTSMARRIMEIREQVAEQLSADLQQMAAENARLQEDYQYEVGAGGGSLSPSYVS